MQIDITRGFYKTVFIYIFALEREMSTFALRVYNSVSSLILQIPS